MMRLSGAVNRSVHFFASPCLARRSITRRAVDFMKDPKTSQPALVTPHWLRIRQQDEEVKVLDASWYLPNMGRDGLAEFKQERIPGAAFFDVDGIADQSTSLPHMLPSGPAFSAAVDALGIYDKTNIVVYDGKGIFSSPRVWWTFRAFGHERISVLDGGLPAWKLAGFEVETSPVDHEDISRPAQAAAMGNGLSKYQMSLDTCKVCGFEEMIQVVESGNPTLGLVVDARPAGRFNGTAPEPRPGSRGGRMPGSVNVPFSSLLAENGTMKPLDELKSVLLDSGVKFDKPLIFTCGSGLTACIVALASHLVGIEQTSVYDGSWSEWGSRDDTPIV